MIFTMRFYRHCDLDLISTLWSIKPKERPKVVKRCIDAYLGIKPFEINDIPLSVSFNDVSFMNEVYSLTIRVTDKEEIFINQLKNGFKNNALKNITRQYIGLHGLSAYATDIDAFSYMNSLNIEKTISHIKQNNYISLEDNKESDNTNLNSNDLEIVPATVPKKVKEPKETKKRKSTSKKKVKETVDVQKNNIINEEPKENNDNKNLSEQEVNALNDDIFALIGGML